MAPAFTSSSIKIAAQLSLAPSSFFLPTVLLSKAKRIAISHLYQFCRAVDDSVDLADSAQEAWKELEAWKRDIDNIYQDIKPHHLESIRLIPIINGYGIEKEIFELFFKGFQKDLQGEMLYPSFDILLSYCESVASAVGLMCLHVFGSLDQESRDFARYLGIAMQLTNILRDVEVDAEIDRIYLPKELISSMPIAKACKELSHYAEQYYALADTMLNPTNAHLLEPARMIGESYRQLLRELQTRGWDNIAITCSGELSQ
jgi:phytoene synthase